ncbi:glycosyltransferase family 9 protein [Compostibacter hankyongensis]
MRRKKIAVLRANALGDFVFVLPALQALRETFPEAEIVYLGREMHRILLEDRPGPVDRVEVIPSYPGVGKPEDYFQDIEEIAEAELFFARMQAERFDIALQLHGGGQYSNPFVLRLGAELTIGLKSSAAPPLDVSVPYVTRFNEILRYLEVVSMLGAQTVHVAPEIVVTERDLEAASRAVTDPDGRPFAVLHPGASDPKRRWPPENFAQVADFLIGEGWQVYINGIAEEAGMAADIVSAMYHREWVEDLSGRLPLPALIGLLSQASLVISNDSGPLHLAHALQAPAIGIYWIGNLVTSMPATSRFHRPVISWTTSCPLCGKEGAMLESEDSNCRHNTSFMRSISVGEVKGAIGKLLNTGLYIPEPVPG